MTDRRSALGALIASFSLVALVGGSALGAHHLENEGGGGGSTATPRPTPVKILVVTPDEDIILVDGNVRLEAQICNANGRKCKLANKARWSVAKKPVVGIAPKRGSQTIVTGKAKGITAVTAKQGGLSGKARIKVNERPVRDEPTDTDADTGSDLRLRLEPGEATFEVGQTFVLTALGCPATSATDTSIGFIQGSGRTDGCEATNILGLNIDAEGGLEQIGLFDHAALLFIEAFGGPADATAHFIGPAVMTDFGGSAPSLFSVSRPYTGPKLGDWDQDGDVDRDDWLVPLPGGLALDDPPIPAVGGAAGADLSGDGWVSSTDVQVHDALILRDGGDVPLDPITSELEFDLDGDGDFDEDDTDALLEAIRDFADGDIADDIFRFDINGDGTVDDGDFEAMNTLLDQLVSA